MSFRRADCASDPDMNDYLKAVPVEPEEPPTPAESTCAEPQGWLAAEALEPPPPLAPPATAPASEICPSVASGGTTPALLGGPADVQCEPEAAIDDDVDPPIASAPIDATIEVFGASDDQAWPRVEADLLLCADALSPPADIDCAVEALPATLSDLDDRLGGAGRIRIAIAVAGDPLVAGPGRSLLAALGPDQVRIHAAIGPLQAALARIGFSLTDLEVLDLERLGPPGVLARLRRGRLYAFRPDGDGTAAIGRLLERAGFHQARVWRVAADPAAPIEALLAFELSDRPTPARDDGYVVAYTVGADGSSRDWPGIPSTEFDAVLPEAARLLALAWLQPGADECGWSIEGDEPALALDWSRERPEARIHCIGTTDERLARFGLRHQAGEGLVAEVDGSFRGLATLPDPNVAFLRAGPEFAQQVRTAWDRLRPAGRMVVAAEHEQSRLELMQFAHRHRPVHWQDLTVSLGDGEARFELAAASSVRLMGWRKPARG